MSGRFGKYRVGSEVGEFERNIGPTVFVPEGGIEPTSLSNCSQQYVKLALPSASLPTAVNMKLVPPGMV